MQEQENELFALEAIYETEDLEICKHDNASGHPPGIMSLLLIYHRGLLQKSYILNFYCDSPLTIFLHLAYFSSACLLLFITVILI